MLCAADRTRVVQLGPASEGNYTGKKAALSQPGSGFASLGVHRILVSPLWGEHGEANLQSPETGLYYFNQRYYDPSLGRFLTEDPAGQALNPYAYAGTLVGGRCCELPFATSLSLINPDGEWFFTAMLSCFGPLGSMLGAAIDGGMTSAAINAGVQLATTGKINWQSVGNSFGSGALSAGMSFGVGEMMQHATTGLGKTLAHGLSGGVSSMASGGSFGSGFVSGAVGNMASEASMGAGVFEQAGIAGLAGGVTSWASGGDFANGFQSGAYNVLYNHYAGGVVDSVKKGVGLSVDGMSGLGQELGGLARAVGNVAAGIPDPVYDVASIAGSLGTIAAYGTPAAPFITGANLMINSGSLYKTYKEHGLRSRQFAVNASLSAIGVHRRVGPVAGFHLNKASVIYSNLDR